MQKGQGALEYLLLAGGAIVVAAILVTLLLSTSSGSISTSKITLINGEMKKYQALGQLQARYSFENNLSDTGGKNYNITSSGSVTYEGGKMYTAAKPSANLVIPVAAMNGLLDFTFMAWYKSTVTAYPLSSNSNEVVIQPGGNTVTAQINGAALPVVSKSVLDGTWHHFALVRQGTARHLYIDCSLLSSDTRSPNALNTTGYFTAQNPGNVTSVDEEYIFNRALSEAEIRTLAGC